MTRNDPGRLVTGERCDVHRVDEPIGWDGRRCLECGHGFRSGTELVEAFNRDVAHPLSRTRRPGRRSVDRVTDPERVPFCPVCLHDF